MKLRLLKMSLAAVAALLFAAQFVRPARTNPPADASRDIAAHVRVTPQVAGILERSCNDCHSNRTEWPWYSRVAPASWFVADHVQEGRRDLNFSEWPPSESPELLKKICYEVKTGFMPMTSYTLLHRDARLTPADVQALCDWAASESERLNQKEARGQRSEVGEGG
ncbi:MAG TPA: heme-binding domain-containing protein [Pyrinomonadaceae bacterium]|nr:heme-binding domain-containing protein [Pyrinomonadaceae bacterium]